MIRVRRRLPKLSVQTAAIFRMASVSFLTRAASVAASLVTVPIVLAHLGTERYGIWIVAIGVSSFFTLADCGLTRTLVTEVSKANGANNPHHIRALISSALATTVLTASIFLMGLVIAAHYVNWGSILNLSSPELIQEMRTTFLVISTIYTLSIVAVVFRESQVGLFQGATANLWDFGGLSLGFLGLWIACRFHLGLPTVAGFWAGGPLVCRVANALSWFVGKNSHLSPRWRYVNPHLCRHLITGGIAFAGYALLNTVATQSDTIFITRFFGPDSVAQYSVLQRMFGQSQVLITLALIAQWPAYSEALGRGDTDWISVHFRRSLVVYFIVSLVIAAVLFSLSNTILHLWVGDQFTAPRPLVFAMAINSIVGALSTVFTYFFMSVADYRRLLVNHLRLTAILLPMYYVLIPAFGPIGALISSIVANVLAIIMSSFLSINSLLPQRSDSRHDERGKIERVDFNLRSEATAVKANNAFSKR